MLLIWPCFLGRLNLKRVGSKQAKSFCYAPSLLHQRVILQQYKLSVIWHETPGGKKNPFFTLVLSCCLVLTDLQHLLLQTAFSSQECVLLIYMYTNSLFYLTCVNIEAKHCLPLKTLLSGKLIFNTSQPSCTCLRAFLSSSNDWFYDKVSVKLQGPTPRSQKEPFRRQVLQRRQRLWWICH